MNGHDPASLARAASALPGSSLAYEVGSWREKRPVHDHRPAPCHSHCPAGEDAQAYIQKVQEGDLRGAWATIAAVNPLPAVTGRICPHPCEEGCNRGRFDAPLAIHAIERFLGDRAIAEGWRLEAPPLAEDAPEVAVVGAGPAGLAAAWHLRRAGVKPVLFDRYPLAGGLLRTAIPLYRLPRRVLDAELERLFDTGIAFRPHTRLGRDLFLHDLEREYAAVVLAVGLQRPRPWSVDGAVPGDLHYGLALLEEWIDVGAAPLEGKVVVVHGGGNTAVDVARMAVRAGAKEVHVITTRALPGAADAVGPDDHMQAFPREVQQAIEEGVIVHPHTTPVRLIIRGARLKAVELAAVRPFKDEHGRTKRVAFEGTERVIEADVVIPATGEVVDAEGIEMLPRRRDYLDSDRFGRIEGRPGLFAAGDATGRGGSISAAVGDGRRAAMAALLHLHRLAALPEEERDPVPVEALQLYYFDHAPRQEPAIRPAAERIRDEEEIEAGLDPAALEREAARCFSCGNCLACDNCWNLCPDFAVLKTETPTEDGSHYVFDYAFCKGCGLCAAECPTAFIRMVDEPTPSFTGAS
ncbi:MAG TPA: glutamate synthase [Rhodospirillales bacterium]|nr:glutamate synthase [Rhodospirillales bacterium]